MKLVIETIDGDLGVMLPGDLAARLNVSQAGAALTAELDNGGLRLKPCDPVREQATSTPDHAADARA